MALGGLLGSGRKSDQAKSGGSYLFIFLVWAIGGCMLGFGVYFYLDIAEMGSVVNNELQPLVIVMTVIGGVLLLISMIGTCGIIVKQSYLLSGFLAALIMVCVAQFAAVVITFMLEASLHYYLQDGMSHSLLFYGKGGENAAFTTSWDYVQQEYRCCGKWGWDDYVTTNASNWFSTNYGSIPDSCCVNHEEGCGRDIVVVTDDEATTDPSVAIWERGCYQEALDSLKDLLIKSGSAVLIFLLVEVVALFLNISLYAKYRHEEGFRVKSKKLDYNREESKKSEEGGSEMASQIPEIPAMKL